MEIVFLKKYSIDFNSIIVNVLISTNPKIFKLKEFAEKSDIIGISYFNNDSEVVLKRLKKEYPKNKIIVGGIGVYQNYTNILKYADFVYFGDAIKFNENSILKKEQLGQNVVFNNFIDYSKMPLIQHTSSRYEFVTEKGCPNKCEFCQISHVQKFSIIDNEIFKKKVCQIESKVKKANISFLNSDGLINYKNADFLNSQVNNRYYAASVPLKMYLKKYSIFGKQNNIKFGIELPSEETRKKHLPAIKQITDNELISSITTHSINMMTFFLIYNYVGVYSEEYKKLFEVIKRKNHNLNLRTSFTTLNISAYTPIVNKLEEHLTQLKETPDFKNVKEINQYKNISHVRVLPAKSNKNAMYDYFRTFLPFDYNIIKPEKFTNAKDYVKGMEEKNHKNLFELMQKRANLMQLKEGELQTIA